MSLMTNCYAFNMENLQAFGNGYGHKLIKRALSHVKRGDRSKPSFQVIISKTLILT